MTHFNKGPSYGLSAEVKNKVGLGPGRDCGRNPPALACCLALPCLACPPARLCLCWRREGCGGEEGVQEELCLSLEKRWRGGGAQIEIASSSLCSIPQVGRASSPLPPGQYKDVYSWLQKLPSYPPPSGQEERTKPFPSFQHPRFHCKICTGRNAWLMRRVSFFQEESKVCRLKAVGFVEALGKGAFCCRTGRK